MSRWRLSVGRSPDQTYIDMQAITRLSHFLHGSTAVPSLSAVDRQVLERFLAHLSTDPRSQHSRSRDIGSLNAFLDAIRRHGWDQTLPTSATFYPDDYPRPDKRLPRGLAEHIMAQVEGAANLELWHNPEGRLLSVILRGQ
jgi:site-specific recombinase XerD